MGNDLFVYFSMSCSCRDSREVDWARDARLRTVGSSSSTPPVVEVEGEVGDYVGSVGVEEPTRRAALVLAVVAPRCAGVDLHQLSLPLPTRPQQFCDLASLVIILVGRTAIHL